MSVSYPKIVPSLPQIRQLDAAAANRIAAGEVVERPASAVKELVENALDAGARRIEVTIAEGGKRLIRVTDDGHGIPAVELTLALSRHATSKTLGQDLSDIRFFGFRGEALPSLGAVGQLSLTSRAAGAAEAARIEAEPGQAGRVRPAALTRGTTVELAALFAATPARLKFLRSDRSETQAVCDVLRRLAMASPQVAFRLEDQTDPEAPRTLISLAAETGDLFEALHGRLRAILGPAFVENALRIEAERDGLELTGYAALPTYSRGAAVAQYLFVNGRPVRDKLMLGALRAAYADVLARGRHPAVSLFLGCPPDAVDVNVHPAKAEVRFREPGSVRGLMLAALRHALAGAGHRSATTTGAGLLGAARPERPVAPAGHHVGGPGFAEALLGTGAWSGRVESPAPCAENDTGRDAAQPQAQLPLGVARGQLHETYVIAQTADGMVIVDQHAAHERLVYERLKAAWGCRRVPSQMLLLPEIVDLDAEACARLSDAASGLAELGLVVEPFGGNALCLRETPAILGEVDGRELLADIADELAEGGLPLEGRIDAVLSRMACHGSVRAGRRMSGPEMDALLREIEAVPLSGQCNHGRPTHVELKLADIERLFGRR